MFFIPRVNVIESSDGFSVEVLGRTGLTYVDQGRSLHVDSEMLAGPSGLRVNSASIDSWVDSDETIDETARQKIVENIRQAFLWRGITIQVW